MADTDLDLKKWLSTYGLLTADRIFEKFNIHLNHDELTTAVKNPRSIYYQLLRIPLKNVFNGIILQQATDYQIYSQKLFIDYLLSGENEKDANASGASIREDIEIKRKHLVEIGEQFAQQEEAHQVLIAESQSSFIKLSRELQESLKKVTKKCKAILQKQGLDISQNAVMEAIKVAIIYYDINDEMLSETSTFWAELEKHLGMSLNKNICAKLTPALNEFNQHKDETNEILSSFLARASELTQNLRHCRTQFYEVIINANDLIKLLPDYKRDESKMEENLQSLNFDPKIGEAT